MASMAGRPGTNHSFLLILMFQFDAQSVGNAIRECEISYDRTQVVNRPVVQPVFSQGRHV